MAKKSKKANREVLATASQNVPDGRMSREQAIRNLTERCNRGKAAIRQQCENYKQQLKTTHATGMVKIPAKVKKMTLGEFREVYGVDLLSALLAGGTTANFGSNNNDAKISLALQTPAVKPKAEVAPDTVMRTIKKGEVLMSANGSPVLGLEDTVIKAPGTVNVSKDRVVLADGRCVDLKGAKLKGEAKNDALEQLKHLQDTLATMVSEIENSKGGIGKLEECQWEEWDPVGESIERLTDSIVHIIVLVH
eukprot:CAMPEP_0194030370 /NCGR_PEP_ID=MMETSP0009_2-20130614/3888_1 /TAXON_ID=210454 /ORGANISM="Grammatophora oceanica, Strain CCMP 410" /LENGTH=249 /DNA_ID=CAMNT_0038670309 /DNA_START=60 /DNA_END=807 /DNA_ORIENTATION=-